MTLLSQLATVDPFIDSGIEPPPPPITFHGIMVSFEYIAPQYALELLKHKHVRRLLKANKVEQFRRDMVAGKWQLDGDAIRISTEGVLLDGHHRCTACVQAGVPFMTLVVRGAIDLTTIDTGTRRSLADTLKLMGYNHTPLLAATVAMLWHYKRGFLGDVTLENMRPSTREALEIVDRNIELIDSVAYAKKNSAMGCLPNLALMHYLCRADQVESIEAFVHDLVEGTNCSPDNPAYVMRERLIKNKDDKARKLKGRTKFAMLIKSWNSYRAGELVSRIQWRGHGTMKEAFPRIDGAMSPEAI